MDTMKLEINIKHLAFTIVIALSVIGTFVYYYFEDPTKFQITTILDIIVAIMAIGAVFYAALNVQLMRMKSQEDLQLGKKARCADIIANWNTPEMAEIAVTGSSLREKELGVVALLEHLKNNHVDQKALFSILNFFERLALLVESEVVDENMAKEYFVDLVVLYWLSFREFIKKQRVKLTQPNHYQKFEELYIKWVK